MPAAGVIGAGPPLPRRRATAVRAVALAFECGAAGGGFGPRRQLRRATLGGWSTSASSSGWRRRQRSIGGACRAVVFELPARIAGQPRFRSRMSASSGPVVRACATVVPVHGDKSLRGMGVNPPSRVGRSTRKLQMRSPRLPPGASWSEGGGVRAGYSGALRRSCEKSVPTGSFEAARSLAAGVGWLAGDLLRGRAWLEESSASVLSGAPNRPLISRGWGVESNHPRQCYELRILMVQA